MLSRLKLPPGIDKESTAYAAEGKWFDSNNIRFRGEYAETVGGWVRDGTYTMEGIGREIFPWTSFFGNQFTALGTNWKQYVIAGESPYDVTPIRRSLTLGADPLTPSSGSNILTVADSSHGCVVNDFVTFSGAPTIGALDASVLNVEHQIFEIVDGNSYKVKLSASASTSAAAGGSSVVAKYQVNVGLANEVTGSGWGVGVWGGTATTSNITTPYVSVGDTTATLTITCAAADIPGIGEIVEFAGIAAGAVNGVELSDLNYAVSYSGFEVLTHASTTKFTITGPTVSGGSPADGGGSGGSFTSGDGWGDAVSASVVTGTLRMVSIDNYNEDLMFCNRGGPIYYWDTSASTTGGTPKVNGDERAKELSTFSGASDTPSIVSSFLVSDRDGHVIAFGCNDWGGVSINNLLVRWSDQNNPFDWTPTATNTSGGQMLRAGSFIVGAVSTKEEVLIWTNSALYSMKFVGPPDIFSFNLVTENVRIVSERAAVDASNVVYFMGLDGFYAYRGAATPLKSTVNKYVFSDINTDQSGKIFAASIAAFNEVYWFYPSSGSVEPDRWVAYNYVGDTWALGTFDMSAVEQGVASSDSLNRTTWVDSVVGNNPISSYVYNWDPGSSPPVQKTAVMIHESGTSANSQSMDCHIESGDIEISQEGKYALLNRIFPDIKFLEVTPGSSAEVAVGVNAKDFPGSDTNSISTTNISNVSSPSSYTPLGNATAIRGRGRALSVKFSSSSTGFRWRLGDTRFEMTPDGRR